MKRNLQKLVISDALTLGIAINLKRKFKNGTGLDKYIDHIGGLKFLEWILFGFKKNGRLLKRWREKIFAQIIIIFQKIEINGKSCSTMLAYNRHSLTDVYDHNLGFYVKL